MAQCDEGYICQVCGKDVAEMADSDLYLRFILGELDPEVLHTTKERHIRCNPTLAQFIVDPAFAPVAVEGLFAKRELDPIFVRERESFVTRGWQRLQEVAGAQDTSLLEYPLPEVRAKLEAQARGG